MRIPKPFNRLSTASRLTLIYVLGYGSVLAVLLLVVLSYGNRQISAELRDSLLAEIQSLRSVSDPAQQVLQMDQAAQSEQGFYLLMDGAGEKRAGNMPGWPQESDIELDGQVHGAWFDEGDLPRGRFDDDVYLPVIATTLDDGSRLLLAREVEQAGVLYAVAEYLMDSLLAALVLAALISWAVSRHIAARLAQMQATAKDIMHGDLSQRVPVGEHDDEFDALARQLNAMLDRIAQLVRGIREVTDSIAHDLRSPLSRIRSRLELAQMQQGDEVRMREAIDQSIKDADGLIKTFNALLKIAQAEAGEHRSEWEPFELSELLDDLAELFQALAEDRGQSLELRFDVRPRIHGSRDLLAQAVGNLLENAIKYAAEDGHIALRLEQHGAFVHLIVEDNGPGIAEQDIAHAMERFVRLNPSRDTPGNGLGLSLVKAVAQLHHAEFVLEDAQPGLRARLVLPIAE